MYLARRLGLVLAFVLTASAGFSVAAAPTVFGGSLEPPACRYDDVLTARRKQADWPVTFLDSIYRVKASFVPKKLVSVKQAGIAGSGKVRKFVIKDLAALAADARKAGAPLKVVSAYRSHAKQKALFKREIRIYGKKRGRESVARPGHSEHQLGTTIDFASAGKGKAWQHADWAKTKPGKWLKQNGWRYGFLLSYPKGKKGKTCYRYEPWHYRYVGQEMAAKVRKTGLTLREYLWRYER